MSFLLLRPRAEAGRPIRYLAHWQRAFCCVWAAMAVAATTAATHAENRFWRTTGGGVFGSTTNWSTTETGATGASVPAANDAALFALAGAHTVSFGANVTNLGLLVGNGSVTFDLNANEYKLTAPQGVVIGSTASQTGRLTIKDGILSSDSSDDLISVGATSATGFLTITTGGRLGNGVIRPDLMIGNGGTGTLTIDDNGRADLGYFVVAQGENSTGTATISGPNAIVTTESVVDVGVLGTGALTIQSAATMSTALAVTLGTWLGANGNVIVKDLGSSWTQASSLTLGSAGDGGLSVQASGSLSTAGAVTIGQSATGVGTGIVTGADSVWNMGSGLALGSSGLGNIGVTSGGRITTAGATAVAQNVGSEGNASVSGAGSRWDTNALTLGVAGTGKMTISAGGAMNSAGNVSFASMATGVGEAVVTGTGSNWNITGNLSIATLGSGSLTVEADAIVSATGALAIGDPAGAQMGTLDFNGGVISVGSFTRAGSGQFNWTNGTLIVNSGAFNNNGAALTINGSDLDDTPALRLASGANVSAASVPNVTIGGNRQGALVVSGGSKFNTTTAAIGGLDTGSGSLVVEGLESAFTTSGDLGVGGTTAAAGGLGTVTLGPNGVLTAGATLRLWDGGTINIGGGTLRFNALAASGGKAVFNSGKVEITSAFNANAAALDALLGSTHVLATGRKIDSGANAFNLQSNLTVSGGEIAGGTFNISANMVAGFEAGATANFTAGITNPASARVYVSGATVAAGATFTNGGELQLLGGTATVNAANVNNTGLVSGSGRVNSVVTNSSAGQVRVAVGQRLEILGASGTNVNNGLIDVDGGAIEFGRAVANSSTSPSTGLIAARNATLRFNGTLANSGSMTFTEGVSDVFGDITNQDNLATPGRIVVTGGAQANFFDDVVNNGVIQVSATGGLASTAVFLGSLSGNGVSGTGHVFLEGDTRPGFSPGTMAFGGDVSFGPLSALDIEIGGLAGGTQFDRVTVADTASVDGALNVSLLGGFKPVIGNSFQILAASGGLTGTFAQLALPALAGGASWSVDYTPQAITLSVGGVLGDFNLDGVVDGADYTVWRDQLGSNSLAADASGNGTIGQEDFNIWKANFGDVAQGGGSGGGGGGGTQAVSAVPEPASLAMLLAFVGYLSGFRRKAATS